MYCTKSNNYTLVVEIGSSPHFWNQVQGTFSDYCGVQTGHPDPDGRNTLGRAHRSQGLVFCKMLQYRRKGDNKSR
jgi:hypothetical protein